jgi:ABC-type glycerol-3-phosphate transport system substrate-binding protein
MANAIDSVTARTIYHIILQALSWDEGWITLTRIAGSSNIYGGIIAPLVAVRDGDVGIGLMSDHYGFIAQNTNPNCDYIIPQDGVLIQGAPIAIPVNSGQPDFAEGFIDFVLSPEGQALLLDESILRLPVMREAFDQPWLTGIEYLYSAFNKTAQLTSFNFNESLASTVDASVSRYFESTLTLAHPELAGCWAAISDAYEGGWINASELEAYADMMANPVTIIDPKTSVSEKFTLDYAIRINNDLIYNASFTSAIKTNWVNAAKTQYVSTQVAVEGTMPFLKETPMKAQNIGVLTHELYIPVIGFLGLSLIYPANRRRGVRYSFK